MGILFSRSDHTYCRIPAEDFKYQGRQSFQGNEKFIMHMDLEQINFQKLMHAPGPVGVDLFGSTSCHQIPRYTISQPDPHAWIVDTYQINWTNLKAYAFRSFALIGRMLAKAMQDKCTLIIISPVWPSQPWYTQLLMCIKDPILIISNFKTSQNSKSLTDLNQTHCVGTVR